VNQGNREGVEKEANEAKKAGQVQPRAIAHKV
jgi:hypothetical protein